MRSNGSSGPRGSCLGLRVKDFEEFQALGRRTGVCSLARLGFRAQWIRDSRHDGTTISMISMVPDNPDPRLINPLPLIGTGLHYIEKPFYLFPWTLAQDYLQTQGILAYERLGIPYIGLKPLNSKAIFLVSSTMSSPVSLGGAHNNKKRHAGMSWPFFSMPPGPHDD